MSSFPFLPGTISLVDRHSGIHQGTGRCRCYHSTGTTTAGNVQIERSGCTGTSADAGHLYLITYNMALDCADCAWVTASPNSRLVRRYACRPAASAKSERGKRDLPELEQWAIQWIHSETTHPSTLQCMGHRNTAIHGAFDTTAITFVFEMCRPRFFVSSLTAFVLNFGVYFMPLSWFHHLPSS